MLSDDNPLGLSAGRPPEGGPEAAPSQEVTKDAPSATAAEELLALALGWHSWGAAVWLPPLLELLTRPSSGSAPVFTDI